MKTVLGIESFLQSERYKKAKWGLVSNSSAITKDYKWVGDALLQKGYDLNALFSPEHGLHSSGADATPMPSVWDENRGLWVHSLYGDHLQPTSEQLSGLDIVLFDIPDVGSRFYTYIWTLSYVMDACRANQKKCVVLDRPNPITGLHAEGPGVQEGFQTFEGRFSLPIRHGWTVGELATWYNTTHLNDELELEVIWMQEWNRSLWWNETSLPWVSPSPAMATLDTATVYPGTCLFEGSNCSEGRGTSHPFEWVGAPFLHENRLAEELNALQLSGVHFRPIQFIPWADKYREKLCNGVQVHVTDRNVFSPVQVGICLLAGCYKQAPESFLWNKRNGLHWLDCLWGSDALRKKIEQPQSLSAFAKETNAIVSEEDQKRWGKFCFYAKK